MRPQKKSGSGGPDGGSETQSYDELSIDDKCLQEAHWGLVRLFVKCHEYENSAFSKVPELSEKESRKGHGGDKASRQGKAAAKQAAKKGKGSKQSQVSNDDTRGKSGKPQAAHTSSKGTKGGKKKAASGEMDAEDAKNDRMGVKNGASP